MDFGLFTCSFNTPNRNYFLQVQVSGDIKRDDTRRVIRKIVERAFQQDHIKPRDNILKIRSCNGRIEYRSTSTNRKWCNHLDEPIVDSDVSELKVQRLTSEFFPSRSRTVQEIRSALLKKWPANKPIVSFFWKFMVIPLSKLAACICPGKVYDCSTLKLKEDPHHRFALENALQEVSSLLRHDTSPASMSMKSQFEDGLNWAKQWRTGDCRDREILANKVADNKDHFVVPSGYWTKDNIFEPILWSVNYDDHVQLSLSQLTYGNETAPRFVFKDVDQVKMEKLVYQLFSLSNNQNDLQSCPKDIQTYIESAGGELVIEDKISLLKEEPRSKHTKLKDR